MTREEQIISEAKKHYYDSINCHNAFLHGVEWADEHPINVWHEASEAPEDDCKEILYQDKYGAWFFALKHDIVVVLEINWEDFAAENISRWAYIDDLLPKGGAK